MSTLSETLRGKPARFRLPLVLTLIWSLVDLASIFLGGFYSIDAYWVIALLAKLAMLGINWWFIKSFFLDGRRELYGAFRKYVGYSIVLGYGALNLPILSWQNSGLIGNDQALFLWAICGLQAILMMGIWLSLRLKQAQVYWGVITAEEASDKKLLQQHLRDRKRSVMDSVLENADMFIQTVFIVIILQLFLVQMYVIPSESMVPTMLKEDRPVVLKTLDGPTIPMSTVKLPNFIDIKRGQIVVFESPAYEPPPLAIKVVQEFLFYLTLSFVNLDKDANGDPKVHYVVKRVTGVPGEKLMMVDDKLYVKTGADKDFRLQEQDPSFSHVDFLDQPENIKSRIEKMPITAEFKEIYAAWDARKNAVDPINQQQSLAQSISRLKNSFARLSSFNAQTLDRQFFAGDPRVAETKFRNQASVWAAQNLSPWQDADLGESDLIVLRHLMADHASQIAFYAFLQSQPLPDAANAENAYDRGVRATNLIHKSLIAERYEFLLGLIGRNANADEYNNNADGKTLYRQAREFAVYVSTYDNRNFPEFPAGKSEYIPAGKFFLLGDNRYNSLDFRFDEHMISHTRALSASDPQSVVYSSMLAPRLLDRSRIIGHVIFRLWPLDRFGTVKP